MKHPVYRPILKHVTQKCPIYYFYRYYGFTFIAVEPLSTGCICKYICARACNNFRYVSLFIHSYTVAVVCALTQLLSNVRIIHLVQMLLSSPPCRTHQYAMYM